MKNFLTNIPLNQVSVFVTIVVSFTYNVLLDRDMKCTCEDEDRSTCDAYMGLPFLIIFFLIVWTDKKLFSNLNDLCGCECPGRWIVVRIFKAVLIGLLWVVSVLIDGDWYVCCKNNFSEQQKQLACKKNDITAQEQVEISHLKNYSKNIGFGLMLGILIIKILMSLSCWRNWCDKDSLYRKLIAEEGESMLNDTLRLKAKYELRDEIRRKIRDGKFSECFDVTEELIRVDPTNKCPGGNMLLTTKLGDVQKFVRISEPNLEEFLKEAFAKFDVPAVTGRVKVVNSSGTELDDDVFEDVVMNPSTGVLTIKYDSDDPPRQPLRVNQPSTEY